MSRRHRHAGAARASAFASIASLAAAAALSATAALAQVAPAREPPAGARSAAPAVPMDSARARELYASNRPEDHEQIDFRKDLAKKARTDSIFADRSRGVMAFSKVSYRSGADGLTIPAYVFAPLHPRGARGHAALVWVHGGVHGNFEELYLPFVKEAVARGYVVITPDYRGSTGHGPALYNAIDYGGKELDDVEAAVDYLKTLPYVDPDRIGLMGWSHGGFITANLLFRGRTPFKAGAAIVPVTNLIFRLSYKGPAYQRDFSTQQGLRGLPFEKRAEYVRRSPYYGVDSLRVPILVHVATNDQDVNFEESRPLIDALRARKAELAETKIYVNPTPGPFSVGHSFSRRVNMTTLERDDSPEQRDSWNRVWTFFEWWLRPYEGAGAGAHPAP